MTVQPNTFDRNGAQIVGTVTLAEFREREDVEPVHFVTSENWGGEW